MSGVWFLPQYFWCDEFVCFCVFVLYFLSYLHLFSLFVSGVGVRCEDCQTGETEKNELRPKMSDLLRVGRPSLASPMK